MCIMDESGSGQWSALELVLKEPDHLNQETNGRLLAKLFLDAYSPALASYATYWSLAEEYGKVEQKINRPEAPACAKAYY